MNIISPFICKTERFNFVDTFRFLFRFVLKKINKNKSVIYLLIYLRMFLSICCKNKCFILVLRLFDPLDSGLRL